MSGAAAASGAAATDGPAGTLATVFDAAAKALQRAGIEQPRLDARLLIAHALDAPPQEILLRPERKLTQAEHAAIATAIARRLAHEPVARIIGRREFWSLNFAVTEATLIPRPDSETLVEAVLAQIADRAAPLRLLDIGTGTGCLLLALLSELPNATGVGTDILPAAVETARSNAKILGTDGRAAFVATHWTDGIAGRFDVIVSNPPYIPRAEIDGLAPEVARFDPRAALDGGPDGLDAYRALAERIPALLANNGFAAVEIGAGQEIDVAGIFERSGMLVVRQAVDLSDRIRCLVLRPR
ncbi:MAG: peptide chain release factor N(5)-glutamine methyltransferase [Alphaproteobacteria bacterium]